MATCIDVDLITGELTANTTPIDSCASYVLMDASTYQTWAPFDPAALNPVTAIEAFGAGFVIFGIPLAVVFGVKTILSMLKGRG